jgi:hypothetical protein
MRSNRLSHSLQLRGARLAVGVAAGRKAGRIAGENGSSAAGL